MTLSVNYYLLDNLARNVSEVMHEYVIVSKHLHIKPANVEVLRVRNYVLLCSGSYYVNCLRL